MITLGLEEPVITPKAWVEMDGFRALCDRCLFVAWTRPLEYAKKFLEDAVDEAKLRIPAVKGVIGRYGDATVCVYRIYIGAPAATMAMELLIAAGVKKFILFGGCGAIHPSVKIYDLVIPTWGVREEGTSYHYLPAYVVPKPSEYVSKAIEETLRSTARELNINLHVGGIWTTDTMFRETRDKVRMYSSKGVLAVDMESTALMTIAMYRGVELGIAHVVTDELYGEKWVMYSDDNKMAEVEKRVVESLIDTLAKL